MILGFGTGEIEAAKRILRECYGAIEAGTETPERIVKNIQEKYGTIGEANKKLSREDAPERYTYFWATYYQIYEGKYIVEFTMHHVNRRHPMSDDGWAVLSTKWILSRDAENEMHIFKEE